MALPKIFSSFISELFLGKLFSRRVAVNGRFADFIPT